MMKHLLLALLCLALFASCKQKTNGQSADNQEIARQADIDYSKAENLIALYKEADSLLQIGKIDCEKMQIFVENAQNYAANSASDTLSPSFLYYAGIFQMKIAFSSPNNQLEPAMKSVAIFNQFIKQYPDYQHVPYCYYYKGQIYENLGRMSDAEGEYRELVHRFPDSDLGKSVADYLKMKGFEKSADELWEEIQKKGK